MNDDALIYYITGPARDGHLANAKTIRSEKVMWSAVMTEAIDQGLITDPGFYLIATSATNGVWREVEEVRQPTLRVK